MLARITRVGGDGDICVMDEAGAPMPDVEIGHAWREGECWRYWGFGCATVSAAGHLDVAVCPDEGWDRWSLDSYDITLERGVQVVVRCADGPCPERMGVLSCVTHNTPDRGRCTRELCTCPDEPDARVIASHGPFAGESASVVDGVATFAHTGRGTLVVHGLPDSGVLSRVEYGGDVFVGSLRAGGTRSGLVAGTYALSVSVEGDFVEWRDIRLSDGETREI